MYIVNDYLGTYGGSTTLLLRMAEWSKDNNEKFKIYTQDESNTEIVLRLKELGAEIDVFNTDSLKFLKDKLLKDFNVEECKVINFILKNYLNTETIKKKYNLKFVNVLYAIHPRTFLKGLGYSNKIFRRLIIVGYRSLLKKLNRNSLIAMDQDIVGKTEEYYNFDFRKNVHIQLLPMICSDMEETKRNIKISSSYIGKTIISACRAEFPYKGYIFGLLDDFEILLNKYQDIKLELVCSGEKEEMNRILEKINNLNEITRSKIILHKWMEYNQLKALMTQCYMFVGMGTGVVDAAIVYVPSIAVKYDTYDNIANNVFCEKPDILVGYTGKAIDVMDRLLSLDFENYKEIAIRCFESAKKKYNINNFFSYINNIDKQKSSLSFYDIELHLFNNMINSFKKDEKYSISKIEKES